MLDGFVGAPFPHFSVRSKDWRYTLCSNGDEELYHLKNDPHEWTNRANSPECETIKAKLKQLLIALRDGDQWQDLNQRSHWQAAASVQLENGNLNLAARNSVSTAAEFANFEIMLELKSDDKAAAVTYGRSFKVDHESVFHQKGWNLYRIRVYNKRHEIYINNRLAVDIKDEATRKAPVTIQAGNHRLQVRNARVRELGLSESRSQK
jgi:hypothetical protein